MPAPTPIPPRPPIPPEKTPRRSLSSVAIARVDDLLLGFSCGFAIGAIATLVALAVVTKGLP